MDEDDFITWWVTFIVVICMIIVFISGYIIGAFFSSKECLNNPLAYGINMLNERYDKDYTCNCYQWEMLEFSFDKDGLIEKDNIETTKFLNYSNFVGFGRNI